MRTNYIGIEAVVDRMDDSSLFYQVYCDPKDMSVGVFEFFDSNSFCTFDDPDIFWCWCSPSMSYSDIVSQLDFAYDLSVMSREEIESMALSDLALD